MKFGITLFPDVGPEEKAPADYYRESFDIVERAEELGFSHVCSIEHHFTGYGGYSPRSMVMLAGLSGRTKTMKLITGAVIPIFNNPLKMAGELGMLDAMSNGRLMVGFGGRSCPTSSRGLEFRVTSRMRGFRRHGSDRSPLDRRKGNLARQVSLV